MVGFGGFVRVEGLRLLESLCLVSLGLVPAVTVSSRRDVSFLRATGGRQN